jgi:uncharacterized protein (TIGR03067 family)
MAVLAPAAGPAVRTDRESLQGSWASVAGPREARFLIAGDRFTFEFVGGDIYMGTFALSPGGMDMTTDAGPTDHVGTVTRCLYQLDGGVLRWCPGKPGSARRPAAFPDVDDTRYLSLVFRRAGRAQRR